MERVFKFNDKRSVCIYFNKRFYYLYQFSSFLFTELMPGVYFRSIGSKAIVKIKNKFDDIVIFKFPKVVYKQFHDEASEILFNIEHTNFQELKKTEIKKIPLKNIIIEDDMGGDSRDCELYILDEIFSNLDFYFFDTQMKIEHSTRNKNLLNICKNSKCCSKTISNFDLDKCIENYYHRVQAYKVNDIYIIKNGKHRVCCAKKTNLDYIYAEVTYLKIFSELVPNHSCMIRVSSNKEAKKLVKNYYDFFKKLNINNKELKKLLEDGISRLGFLEVLEKRNNKSLYEVCYNIKNLMKNEG
ncbi:hypothetical protein QTH09_16545 [Clostridium perfringens]|nr:hypothetical protein [Clostridium perfringens]